MAAKNDRLGADSFRPLEARAELTGEVDYLGWFLRILGWDVGLTGIVAITPMVTKLMFPGNWGAITIVTVVLPIGALFLRGYSGYEYIHSNYCDSFLRWCQSAAFGVGILLLFVFDAVMLLSHMAPVNFLPRGGYAVVAALFVLYLMLMTFAMYPGRSIRDEASAAQ